MKKINIEEKKQVNAGFSFTSLLLVFGAVFGVVNLIGTSIGAAKNIKRAKDLEKVDKTKNVRMNRHQATFRYI